MGNRVTWFWFLIVLLTLGGNATVWYGDFPLGVPGEWTWPRRPPDDLLENLLLLVIWAALLAGFVWLGGTRLPACGRWEVGAWLTGLVICGFAWLCVLQDAAPFPFGLRKAAWVLYYPGSSGYFTEARYRVNNLPEFLAGYEAQMSQGDVLHIGTHPPGLIVGYRGLMWLCEHSPWLEGILQNSQPVKLQESFSEIAQRSHLPRMPLLERDRAVLWLAALLMQFFAILTVVPLYFLLRRDYSRITSWLAISFWPLVPAVAVFLPKSDTLFPFLGTLFLYLWIEGWTSRSFWMCVAAGAVLWLGLFLSLALLPVVFLAGLLTVWEGRICPPEERPPAPAGRLFTGAAGILLGFLVPILCLWSVSGMNLLSVWSWNYRNHAAFYSQFARTYWKWLLVNPLELAIAGGLPIAALALASIQTAFVQPRSRRSGVFWACAITWLCLLLSGKNRGEAARLWIVLMPGLIWLAASTFRFDGAPVPSARRSPLPRDLWLKWCLAWGLQLSAAVVITMHVTGFLVHQ